jgi:SAM-dependent methyltransferase
VAVSVAAVVTAAVIVAVVATVGAKRTTTGVACQATPICAMHSLILAQVIKQLPPSASQLTAWDVGGAWAAALMAQRPDLAVQVVSVLPEHWPNAQVDAVLGYDLYLSDVLLRRALAALRAGGRLVIANPYQPFNPAWGERLGALGYVRLLLEPLDTGGGMLLRGERPHTEASTLERVQVAARADADALTLATYRGRFVHLLVRQFPNKPVWRLTAEDRIVWQATCSDGHMLAFTSLPKAVAFMQMAVLAGRLRDVNKVAKFRREVVAAWPLRLNPTLDALPPTPFTQVEIDHTLAEAPDE